MKRRREVLIEIEREIVISTQQQHYFWCADCGKQVHMLNAHEAARTLDMSESRLYDEIHAGRLHATVTDEGLLLVCADSALGQRAQNEIPRFAQLLD